MPSENVISFVPSDYRILHANILWSTFFQGRSFSPLIFLAPKKKSSDCEEFRLHQIFWPSAPVLIVAYVIR